MELRKKVFYGKQKKLIKIAIIYTENQIFAVDQSGPKNLHNRYECKFYNIDELQNLFFEF